MAQILDTHQHLMYGNRFQYQWASGIEALSSADFSIETYTDLAKNLGIESALFMEVDVDKEFLEEEAMFFKSLADDEQSMTVGVITACRPENDKGFEEWLEKTQDQTYVGYRRILHTQPDELSQSDTFIQNVRKIGQANKCFDVCMLEKQLPLALELAKKCDHTQLILDHCGVPNIATGNFDSWAKDIAELAKLEHVACKISGVLAYCSPEQNKEESIKPYVEHCIEQFGWERVIWGSDWPVVNLGGNLAEWVGLSQKLVASASPSEQSKLFYDNAQRIYQIAI